MFARTTRALVAAAATAAVVTTLGLTGAVAAAAAPARGPATVTTGDDPAFAGYVTTGTSWRFRFVATSVPVPACPAPLVNNAVADIELFPNTGSEVAHINVACGGFGSVSFGSETHASGVFHLSPSVGNVLKISIYRDVAASRDEFVATNTATGRTEKVTVATSSSVVYRHAVIGAFLVNPALVEPPPASERLWVFRDSAVTSYSGIRGTLVGPWPVIKFSATTTGTSSGTVLMFPSDPTNGGHNFGVWLNGAS